MGTIPEEPVPGGDRDAGQAADPATFPQLIRAAAARFGDAPAILLAGEGGTDEAASFAALDRRSAALARGLLARGVGKGARIGFIHGNGPDFAITLAGIARIGAIAIPVSTLLRADELVRVLRQSDVGGLIVQRRLLGHDLVARLGDALGLAAAAGPTLRLAAAPYLRWIAAADGEGGALPPAIEPFSALIAAGADVGEALLRAVEAEVHPTDQMIEIYTSGSMAAPKGVRHDHGPVMARARYLAGMTGVAAGARLPARMPMFWVGGLMMSLLANWLAGATTLCAEANATDSRFAMGSVLAEADLAALPPMRTIWGLGMTETLGPYSHADVLRVPGYPLCPPLDHVADGFELRVADADGRPVADGATGEIQVRGAALSLGLHKVPRAAAYTPDGYYRTGDLGVADGARIHFVGRDGDIIKTASANVSPAEVELELQRLDGIEAAYVLGLPDRERGQAVVAAIVAAAGATPDFERIRQALLARLSAFKVPRAYVAIAREEVPMLPSNKVARRVLERLVAERLGRAGAGPAA